MLQRAIPVISKQMLTQQLREMEEDGIIERKIFAEIPPRVEYYITEYGQSLFPVIDAMSNWGLKGIKQCWLIFFVENCGTNVNRRLRVGLSAVGG